MTRFVVTKSALAGWCMYREEDLPAGDDPDAKVVPAASFTDRHDLLEFMRRYLAEIDGETLPEDDVANDDVPTGVPSRFPRFMQIVTGRVVKAA